MPGRDSIHVVIALSCVPLAAGTAVATASQRCSPPIAAYSDSLAILSVAGSSAKQGMYCGIGVNIRGTAIVAGHIASAASHLPGASRSRHGIVATLPAPRQVAVAARGSDMPWTITTTSSDAITTGPGDTSASALAPAANEATRPRDRRRIVALPEPASLALILVGVLGVTAVRARRARRPKPGPEHDPV